MMGKLRFVMDVNVPRGVILEAARGVSNQFFLRRPEYKRWYNVHVTENNIIYEIKAFGIKLRFHAKVEALEDNKSRVTLEASWSTIWSIMALGYVKNLARFGIDTMILQLLSLEYGYQEGMKAKR